jgi:hypothetical protein
MPSGVFAISSRFLHRIEPDSLLFVHLPANQQTQNWTSLRDLALLIPVRVVACRMRDPCAPPDWSANPSSWRERLPIVALASVGFAIATYLAVYQYRVVGTVWEPFFGDGSRTILNSPISHALPVSDAALGAFGYLLDVIAGVIGGRKRWMTSPWIVIVFGIAVGPLGATSLLLVILQPVLYNTWCTLCLASAAISIVIIGPAFDEVLASLQFLQREHEAGRSAWRAFWGRDKRR